MRIRYKHQIDLPRSSGKIYKINTCKMQNIKRNAFLLTFHFSLWIYNNTCIICKRESNLNKIHIMEQILELSSSPRTKFSELPPESYFSDIVFSKVYYVMCLVYLTKTRVNYLILYIWISHVHLYLTLNGVAYHFIVIIMSQ